MNDPELLPQINQTNAQGSYTLSEILTQPVAWRAALEVIKSNQVSITRVWQEEQPSDLLITGCGSTYYLSLIVAPLLQQILGIRARAMPASELLLFPESVVPAAGNPLLLTISRSGSTTETVRAVKAYKQHYAGKSLYIGCYADSLLAALNDVVLAVREGQEQSVAQTRSFSSMLVAAQALALLLANQGQFSTLESLPGQGIELIKHYHPLARQLGEQPQFERFYFLGSGARYGLACEANLKMKEMSLSIAEAFHFMEFRHGPMSMVNERTLVIGLLSDAARDYELAVLREMRALGAQTLVLSEQEVTAQEADYQVNFASGLSESARLVHYLPILQLLSYHRALLNGQNPDQPHNLTAVVTLEAEQAS